MEFSLFKWINTESLQVITILISLILIKGTSKAIPEELFSQQHPQSPGKASENTTILPVAVGTQLLTYGEANRFYQRNFGGKFKEKNHKGK